MTKKNRVKLLLAIAISAIALVILIKAYTKDDYYIDGYIGENKGGFARVEDLIYGYIVGEASKLPNFIKIKDIAKRKQAFLSFIAPMIGDANEEILKDRAKIKAIYEIYFADWSEDDLRLMKLYMKKYGLGKQDIKSPKTQNELLSRVDFIPLSLALSQAAIESGWGTSRFAIEGNNLFGHWCYNKGCGIIPEKRSNGDNHEVQKFATIKDSIRKYIHNLNSNRAYKQLRELRAINRNISDVKLSLIMANGLQKYSQKGIKYVEIIHSVIKSNDFTQLLQEKNNR